jgi:hypothetical protein
MTPINNFLLFLLSSSSLFRIRSSLAGSQNSTGLTRQVILIRLSAKTFPTVRNVRSVAAFYITVCTAGRKLSSLKQSRQWSGIKPVLDKTNGTITMTFIITFQLVPILRLHISGAYLLLLLLSLSSSSSSSSNDKIQGTQNKTQSDPR